jgi:hypothetical protein
MKKANESKYSRGESFEQIFELRELTPNFAINEYK